MRHQRRRLLQFAWLVAALGQAAGVQAEIAPILDEPLQLWVGYNANNPLSELARGIAERLEAELGVPVTVENRPGAGGRLAAQGVAQAERDEAMLLLAGPATTIVAPLVFDQLAFDPMQDLVPISLAVTFPLALAASPQSNLTHVADLGRWVRANPLGFTVGVPGAGTLPYFLAGELDRHLPETAEIINYRDSGPLLADLMSDRLPLAIDTVKALKPAERAGRATLLAVSGLTRHPDFPETPTFAEVGLPFTAQDWFAFFAPARMPAGTRRELGERLAHVLQDPTLRDTLVRLGFTPKGLDPTDTVVAVEEARAQWWPLIEASGFRVGR